MRAKSINENIFQSKSESSSIISNLPEVKKNNELVHKYFGGDVSKVLNLMPSEDLKEIVENSIQDIEKKYIELYKLGKDINSENIINTIDNTLSREFYNSYMRRNESQSNHFDNLRKSLDYLWGYGHSIDFLHSATLKSTFDNFKKIGIQMIDPKPDGKVFSCQLSPPAPDDQMAKIADTVNNIDPKYRIETSYIGSKSGISEGHDYLHFYHRKKFA